MLVKVNNGVKDILVNTDHIISVDEYNITHKNEHGICIYMIGDQKIMVPNMTLKEFESLCNIYSVPGAMVTALIEKMDKMEDVIMGGFQHVGNKLNYIGNKVN